LLIQNFNKNHGRQERNNNIGEKPRCQQSQRSVENKACRQEEKDKKHGYQQTRKLTDFLAAAASQQAFDKFIKHG